MTQFAVRHTVGDYSEILEKFEDKESAIQAAKVYREKYFGGTICVLSADFESRGWKEREEHRIYKVYW